MKFTFDMDTKTVEVTNNGKTACFALSYDEAIPFEELHALGILAGTGLDEGESPLELARLLIEDAIDFAELHKMATEIAAKRDEAFGANKPGYEEALLKAFKQGADLMRGATTRTIPMKALTPETPQG